MPVPNRGEVWLVDLGLAAKVRPVLVLSVKYSDEDYALVAVVPHTTSPRSSTFEVSVSVDKLKPGAFNIQGLLAVPAAKFLRKITEMSSDQIALIENSVKGWLGLTA